jgi:dGTPase
MSEKLPDENDLAPYAMRTAQSRGRRHPEPAHPFRTPYQRDRDRILYSTAFRRLMHKTQVLLTQTNDHHRTRLTHTLEVTQIARTIARRLGLNEDLTEAIALSHDLGHPPFGHAGEKALDECMADHGGFEHNLHALRIVEVLEYPYPNFPGLNLTWEVREAMALHSSHLNRPERSEFAPVVERGEGNELTLDDTLPAGQPLLEAQVADAADSLAYDTHDIDDALSAGLISFAALEDIILWRQTHQTVKERFGELAPEQFQPTMIRALIDQQVTDLLEHTQERMRRERIGSTEDVRAFGGPLVCCGPQMRERKADLEAFLGRSVYHHVRVVRMAHKGAGIVRALFAEFCKSPLLLAERYRKRAETAPLPRIVCDYVAGMTDRYAQDEYLRLFHPATPP